MADLAYQKIYQIVSKMLPKPRGKGQGVVRCAPSGAKELGGPPTAGVAPQFWATPLTPGVSQIRRNR